MNAIKQRNPPEAGGDPGMWWWMPDPLDGIYCVLPNGQNTVIPTSRFMEGESPFWTITGDWDDITVTPSIWFRQGQGKEAGEWHGFLTDGEWIEC